ncbi:hypothetical protein LBMAG46_42170 [Planctomycetia bacterium]|nr:hypothetical protein LBMAG46_42170 [Planctomycetia bacterium]
MAIACRRWIAMYNEGATAVPEQKIGRSFRVGRCGLRAWSGESAGFAGLHAGW